MCSMIDSGEKGYTLPEQILLNSLVLYLTLHRSVTWVVPALSWYRRNLSSAIATMCL